MCLIQYNHRVLPHLWVKEALSQQHAIGHVLYDGLGGCEVFEPNLVPHFLSELYAHFLADTLGDGHCGHTTGLCAGYLLAFLAKACFNEVLGHLSGLSWACFADNDEHLIVAYCLKELLAELEDWKRFLLLLHGKVYVFNSIELNWWDKVVRGNHGLGRLWWRCQSFLLEFTDIFAVLGELRLLHSRLLECTVWQIGYLDWVQTHSSFRGLALQERCLLFVEL